MKQGISRVMMLLGAGLVAVALVMWLPDLGGGLAGVASAGGTPLGLYAGGALLFAMGSARMGSASLVAFYFLLGLMLPVLGMLTVAGLSRVLASPSEGSSDELSLEVGNPIVGRGAAGAAPLYLKPVATMMREEGAASIGQMILGLSKNGGAERGYQVLRRYQQDGDVELQFYAQSAQRGATEGLELRLKRLRERLEAAPEDAAVRVALAEVLVELAGRRTTSGSDANAYVRRALEHLRQAPESARRAALEVRGYLLVREPPGARAALERLPEDDLRRGALEVEVLYAERDWARLAARVGSVATADIPLRTALAFWKEGA